MSANPFLLEPDAYQRELSPLQEWIRQTAWYAAKRLNKPFEQCLAHLQQKIKSQQLRLQDPQVAFFHREDNGDRHYRKAPLSRYLGHITQNKLILAATGTSYLPPEVKASPIVGYLDINVIARSRFKKLSQKYEFEGDKVKYRYYHNAQDNRKRANNSVSGGFVAGGSVIKNTSAHSTLTSTTRSIASLSNASNERLIAGNRHYFTADIVLNNIVSIASKTDYATLEAALTLYGLVYPTVEQTMACITFSTDLYFRDHRKIEEIRQLVSTLTDLERAAFVYTGDLYHLRQLNEDFMCDFITRLSRKGDMQPVSDPRKAIYAFDEQIINYAHQINLSMLRGKGKDYAKLTDDEMAILYNTCQNIISTVEHYKLFLQAFFLTRNHPPTVATIQNMVRRTVVLSDTDSTMFSVDEWVHWYFKDLVFNDASYAVGGAIMYMATQSIAHILACFSANMGVERKRLFSLAMKPEYVFPVFAQTSVAKHYYTAMIVKEGAVYKDIKMEIKGVHMKDSTVPNNITSASAAEMERIIRAIMAGERLSLQEILNKTIAMEQDILTSIHRGETKYLKRIRIKERTAYKNGGKLEVGEYDRTNFRYFTLWDMVFAPTYGTIPPPPYSAVTIPINLPNQTAVKAWLAGLQDQSFAQRFKLWMDQHGITTIGQLMLPIEHCQNNGVPSELHGVLDSNRIALALTRSFRNVVESHGFFTKPDTLLCHQFPY